VASYANNAAKADELLNAYVEKDRRKQAIRNRTVGTTPEDFDSYRQDTGRLGDSKSVQHAKDRNERGARRFGTVYGNSRPDDGDGYAWEYQGMTQPGRQASGRDGTALGLGSPATGIWKKVIKPAAPQQEKAEEPYVPQPAKPFDPNPGQQADNVRGSYFAGFDNPAFSPHLDAKRNDFYSDLVGSAGKRSRYIQANLPEVMRADAMQSISEFSQATGNAVAGMRSKAVDVSSVFDPDKRFAGQSLYAKLQDDLRKAGNVA
jgi:hypothetical protein